MNPSTTYPSTQSTKAMLSLLQEWVNQGWLRPLDLALARLFHDKTEASGDAMHPLLALATALTSYQVGRGHVCLDFQQLRANPHQLLSLTDEETANDEITGEMAQTPAALLADISDRDWRAALNNDALVDTEEESSSETQNNPLVRSNSRLYLRRYWQYEQTIRQGISQRSETSALSGDQETALTDALSALFPENEASQQPNWQKIACALAARRHFSIITGGPGTGKTTTVVRLLAALQHVALSDCDSKRPFRIGLAAPTGKAAARLNESIAGAVERLPLETLKNADAIREHIPTQVKTLHRLLGSRPDTRRFRHHLDNPLDLDVLVIDEASMVDMEMTACVFDALPNHGRLILLGDKDQLASVEAGAVLGDLCRRANEGHYQAETQSWVKHVTSEVIPDQYLGEDPKPLDQCITMLRHSHRFDAGSGIGQLAAAVNQGAPETVKSVWRDHYPDIGQITFSDPGGSKLKQHCCEGGASVFPNQGVGRKRNGQAVPPPVGYRDYLQLMKSRHPGIDAPEEEFDQWARTVLAAFNGFRLLCANRRGPFGVEIFNQRIADALYRRGLLNASHGWYPGRPVLVTNNDYSLGLMNGDIGITFSVPRRSESDGRSAPDGWLLRVAFPAQDGSGRIKWIVPSRLQAVETAFAMTVHKSQGSEFKHTCLVLPDRINPVITRELIYTAITRASDWFSLALPHPEVLYDGIQHRVMRASGLTEHLNP